MIQGGISLGNWITIGMIAFSGVAGGVAVKATSEANTQEIAQVEARAKENIIAVENRANSKVQRLEETIKESEKRVREELKASELRQIQRQDRLEEKIDRLLKRDR